MGAWVACQTPLPSNSSSVSQRLTGFVPCAGVGQRVAECPTPLPLRDKSQSVRVRCNTAPRSLPINKIGIYSGGIRTSRLEVFPKGAFTVLSIQTGAGKGSTQGASQDNSCSASQESTASLDRSWQRKHSRRFPRQQLRCLPREYWITGPVLVKEALKALPKTAVAVPPKILI